MIDPDRIEFQRSFSVCGEFSLPFTSKEISAEMSPASKSSAFWRQAGLSYLQYLSIASKVVRVSLKEPARTRAFARENFFYNKTLANGEKVAVTSLVPK